MKKSILNDKTILAVDDETDILQVIKEEILLAAPDCLVDTATTKQEASEFLASYSYSLVILDIMGVQGFDLLKDATSRSTPIPTVILTAHAFSPESLRKSVELGARAYLPKGQLGSLVPFLEDILTYEYGTVWRKVLKSIEGTLAKSWGPYWRKPDSAFWDEFEKRIEEKK